jgi:hypothetical protein
LKNREMKNRTIGITTQREKVAFLLLDDLHLQLAEASCLRFGTELDTLSTLRTLTSTKYEYSGVLFFLLTEAEGRSNYSEYSS